MLNHFLCMLIQSLAVGPAMGLALENMLEIRENAPPKWLRMGYWCGAALLFIVQGLFFRDMRYVLNYQAVLLLLVVVLVSFRWFYAGRLRYQLSAVVMLVIAGIAAEAIAALLLYTQQIQELSGDFTKPDMLLVSFIGAVASNTCILLVVCLWRRFRLHAIVAKGSWLVILATFFLSVPTAFFCAEAYRGDYQFLPIHIAAMLGALALNFGMVCVLYAQTERERVTRELLELRYQTELEQRHYQNIEARREELAKIRHDYNNQLGAVQLLVQQGRTAEAEELIRDLLDKVASTKEFTYCAIPIINAVVSQKEGECRSQGIELTVDLLLPPCTDIPSVDLCSVCSNLLDNAIRACTQLPEGTGRSICLTGRCQGDYLLMRCRNPALQGLGGHPQGSGYGLKILRDIAGRYHGDFQTRFEDGIFTAQLIVLDPGGIPESR